ncbi:MFS transporter [Pseudomonas sp. B21-056]|jgi:DHA2 family multidrug resistance protein|uniref:MFS transporter n=1 Tax=Pseudomonas sp. B21-056 TaxID=2895495 RepID=UPI0022300FDF|nr:MFS transporter [Pseudomonas sp. B21-056]UZE21472.1 MFS transporter [Pseudomonas sp. B21-056]
MNVAAVSPVGVATGQAPQVQSAIRPLVGLVGIFLAAMMAGLNTRVGALALADVRGALGLGFDDGSWLTTAYSAGELIAMPFSAWFALTLSLRRFELWMLGTCTLLALILPFIHDLELLLTLRFAQGIASGTTIPLLMMAALKFLPPAIRLYGLALYAMTATFAPNLSIWLAGSWTDGLHDWRWVYWQIIPLALVAAGLIAWGLPREPVQVPRFRQANWSGMACGVPALGLITVALDQGVRLDWFHSPLITTSLVMGLTLMAVYLLTEWYHPSPFIKLQILGRRNLGLGCTLFLSLLVVLMSSSLLPASYLGPLQNYRPLQMASIGLIVALPQLVLGPVVALLLYRKWVDARIVFASGLLLIALACLCGAQLTADWNRDQFVLAQTLQAFGQPMAVVSMLFLITSVVQPPEGPYVSGTINTLRAFGSLFGAAVIGQLMTVRGRFHGEMLLDQAALAGNALVVPEPSSLMGIVSQQALVLSIADAYRVLGVLALLMIPLVLRLTYIPAPVLTPPSPSHG